MVSWSRHQARVKRRVLNLAQCEHESDVSLRLLALQEEEEEEPAHYKLLPLYEGYLEHRKIRFQKSLIVTRAEPERRALILSWPAPWWWGSSARIAGADSNRLASPRRTALGWG